MFRLQECPTNHIISDLVLHGHDGSILPGFLALGSFQQAFISLGQSWAFAGAVPNIPFAISSAVLESLASS